VLKGTPFAMNMADASTLPAVVQEAGFDLRVTLARRNHPTYRAIARLL
jgi:predicted dehydrogenase